MTSPFDTPEMRRLASELRAMRREVDGLRAGAATAQAGRSSLDGGTYVIKDTDGTPRQIQGFQADGTYTTIDVNAPAPPTPTAPVLTALAGGLKVEYDGKFLGGEPAPSDLKIVELHIDLDPDFFPSDATRDAAFSPPVAGSATFSAKDNIGVAHYVRFVAVNTSGVRSVPSAAVMATPRQITSTDLGPNSVDTIALDDGAVTHPKSATGVTSNLVPDPGFNDAGWRAKRAAPPWGFVDGSSVGFPDADWLAYCGAATARAVLAVTLDAGVPVVPGESYYLAYDAARSASGAGEFFLELEFRDSAGATVDTTGEQGDPLLAEVREIAALSTSGFDSRTGQITVPNRAATMHLRMVRLDPPGSTAGQLYLDRVELRSVVSQANSGQRVETSPYGVIVFDGDDNPIGSINSDGGLSMVTGQFNDSLTYQGTEVSDLLNQRALGEVSRVDAGASSSPTTTTEIVWLEFEFTATKGRAYKLRSSGLIARNTGNHGLCVRYTTDGTRPLVTSPVLVKNETAQNGTVYLASDLGGLADSGDVRVRMCVSVRSWDGSSSVYWDPADPALGFSAWVEDTGPRQAPTGGVVNAGSGGSTSATTQTFVKSYNCTWSRSWADTGFQQNSPMYQGYYSSVYGNNFSAFGFNYSAVAADLAGATVTKLEVYLYAENWYYNYGGEVWLGTTGLKNPPGNNVYPADAVITRFHWHLNKPEGRWVDLGAVGVTIGNELKSGATGAFVIDARHPNNNLNDYGRFTGFTGVAGDTSPGLRITYSKAV